MLRTLFKFNLFASLAFGALFALAPDFLFQNFGWDEVSPDMKAVAFMWGAAIQPGLAVSQYVNSLPSITSNKALLVHGKIHSVWWTTCGVVFYSQFPKVTTFGIANVAFMLAYGAMYGFHSFVKPPKVD